MKPTCKGTAGDWNIFRYRQVIFLRVYQVWILGAPDPLDCKSASLKPGFRYSQVPFKTGLTVPVHHVLEDRNIRISLCRKLKSHNVEWTLNASLSTGFMCLRTEPNAAISRHGNDFSDFINGWEFDGCQLLSDHVWWKPIDWPMKAELLVVSSLSVHISCSVHVINFAFCFPVPDGGSAVMR